MVVVCWLATSVGTSQRSHLLAIAIPFTAWLMQDAPSGRSAGAPPASRVMWQIAPCRFQNECDSRQQEGMRIRQDMGSKAQRFT